MPSPGSSPSISFDDRDVRGPAVPRRGAQWLEEARDVERAGCIPEAMERYQLAITAAEQHGEPLVQAEALRRLAVLHHHRNETDRARELGRRSYELAMRVDNVVLAAEALNTLGGLDLMAGSLEGARATFVQALDLGGSSRELRAREVEAVVMSGRANVSVAVAAETVASGASVFLEKPVSPATLRSTTFACTRPRGPRAAVTFTTEGLTFSATVTTASE